MKQKNNIFLVITGSVLCIFGQIFRIGAQQTAKRNFNLAIQTEKQEDHELVTHGVYSISRHPSYLGFFLHSLGSQIILGNKLCLIASSISVIKFYQNRIPHEEKYLIKFFGDKYIKYRESVPIGIPFVDSVVNKILKQES